MLISAMSPYAQKAFGRKQLKSFKSHWMAAAPRLLEWIEVQPITESGGKGTRTLYKGNLTREKKLFA